MSAPAINDLLATIRRLSLDERRALIERAAREMDADHPGPAAAPQAGSLIGLMADEPEVVDKACSLIYERECPLACGTFDE